MKQIKLSVVIPSYNYGAYLETAIESVLGQGYPDVELIVLDGGSTDNTLEVIKKYESKIAFWRSHTDICSNAAVNEGFQRATGDIVGLLCADDYYEPGIFKDVVAAFEADPELDICSFWARYKTTDGSKPDRILSAAMDMNTLGESAPNVRFYRKYVFDSYGTMAIRCRNGEFLLGADWDMMLRFSLLPIKHRLLERVGYTYLMQPNSFSYGEKSHLVMPKMLEEHVEIMSRFLFKKHLYSRTLRRNFRLIHSKATAKLHLIKLLHGDVAEAARYRALGMGHNPFWAWRLYRIKRSKKFSEFLRTIADAKNLSRVQTTKS